MTAALFLLLPFFLGCLALYFRLRPAAADEAAARRMRIFDAGVFALTAALCAAAGAYLRALPGNAAGRPSWLAAVLLLSPVLLSLGAFLRSIIFRRRQ